MKEIRGDEIIIKIPWDKRNVKEFPSQCLNNSKPVERKRKSKVTTMPERFKVTRSAADLGGSGGLGSGSDLRTRNGRHHDEEAATGRLLPLRNCAGE